MFIFNCCGNCGSSPISDIEGGANIDRKPSQEVVSNFDQVDYGDTTKNGPVVRQPTVYRAIEIEDVIATETVTEVATPMVLTRTKTMDLPVKSENGNWDDKQRTVRVEVHCSGEEENVDDEEDESTSNAETDITTEALTSTNSLHGPASSSEGLSITKPPQSLSPAPQPASSNASTLPRNPSPLPPLPPHISLEDEGRGSTPPLEEHDYEDIYSIKGRDSGSHSRSPSTSSVHSDSQIVAPSANNESSESGVSSPSPSELGNKSESEENEKIKLENRHSLPHQVAKDNRRSLKRVVSVPVTGSPPPPPPPPPSEDSSLSTLSSLPASPAALSLQAASAQLQPVQGNNQLDDSNETPGGGGQVGHLVNKQMVLPFIPPKFGDSHDPEALIKPSEYLKSLQGSGKQGPSLTPPVSDGSPAAATPPGPPPPPVGPPPPPPPPPTHQPLSTISIQDITSVQLKRTATKTMSCPHPSLNGNIAEPPFQTAKENLIAELKMSRDISGIKKLKVERVEMEKKQGKEIASTISKQYTMPDKDAAGNPIPEWKRQMLAKKAAEKARKEAEEELAREAEQKRLQAIPAWKRHLLQKKGELN